MIKLIAAATFALAFAVPVQAMPRVPLHQPDSMITQVREGCGVGRYRVNGVCVTRRYGYYGYRSRYYGYRPRVYGYYGYRRGYYDNRPFGFYGWRGRALRRW
jgi:hypothetical protein